MSEASEFPLHGYEANRTPIAIVDGLSDEQLEELNRLLEWRSFVVDSKGRRFGRPASLIKRNAASAVPDPRILLLEKRGLLKGSIVLELGCFEGIHTAALAQRAARVKACDSRVSNVVKTAVRCAMFQVTPTLFVWDIEKPIPQGQDIDCDVLFHVGVLYHLLDPVCHLRMVGPHVKRAIMLDTHYARPDEATESYNVEGRDYSYRKVGEGGLADPFSGMYSSAKWLTLSGLLELLRELGFAKIEVTRDRQERNGPRCRIIAER